ncbi:MAG: hypothetical protein JNM56_01975 [Planctomycetia bacterium]|nr:hypothetical protein [Planctomycetia bacterium]
MTTSSTTKPVDLDDPKLRGADAAAVLEHLVSGKPLDPVLQERVRARAEQVTDAIRRDRGLVDDATFQSLLDDEA